MHIVLLTHYFPPEVNAPASRSFEHAEAWVRAGHRVTVITAAPSHPAGRIYPGHRNAWSTREDVHGIEVIRIWTWVAANRGTVGRMASFASYFLSVLLHLPWLPRGDRIVSTSPQFFCGLAGWLLKRKDNRWILEIRDLWPESIVAVGAMRRSPLIRILEKLEAWAYRTADLVVSVTPGFIAHIAHLRGRNDIAVIRNGIQPRMFEASEAAAAAFREAHRLNGKFVASYLGTHGMAHALDKVLDAAAHLRHRSDIVILLAGNGAERDGLLARKAAHDLNNVIMLDQLPRAAMPAVWAASDAALITLRASETFKAVLPSKMFEAMATGTPILLGVQGEAQALLEEAGAGIAVPPEDAAKLAQAIVFLADNPSVAAKYATAGRAWCAQHADREALAMQMLHRMEPLA